MDRDTSLGAQTLNIDPRMVVHETVDDETIIIDLESGAYFSLTASGPEIWSLIVSGATVNHVIETLKRRYPDDAPDEAALALIDEIVAEGLVQPQSGNGAVEPAGATGEPTGDPFVPPRLMKFTDLQEILLLDPVHDIDEAGWPHQPQP
jgi:hypothetical protein